LAPGLEAMSDTAEEARERGGRRSKYLYGEIVSKIRQMIDSGELRVGDRLPPERALAGQFKVSRNSVRQAIQALSEKGILESRQGDGTYVSAADDGKLEGALAAAIQARKESLREIMEFRLLIEPQIAALAARRITRAHLDRLKIIVCDQERKNLSGEGGGDLDAAFHFEVARAAGNQVLLRVVRTIMEIVNESRSELFQGPERRRLSVVGHLELINALESGDEDRASSAMKAHLRSVEQVVLGDGGEGSTV
jgi:GntR family transcriptional regulator, transcriptional repressor for pyruvate dehydrogenase complex